MIEKIFVFDSTRSKQRSAPLLQERELYLSYLLDAGFTQKRVRSVAAMLLHVVRLMELNHLRLVDKAEIEEASIRWLSNNEFRKSSASRGDWSQVSFRGIATRWLRFHNQIKVERTSAELISNEFAQFLKNKKGATDYSVRGYQSKSLIFLRWALPRCGEFSMISLNDVEKFIEIKRADDCLPRTIASYCAVIRSLFRYATRQGLTTNKVAGQVKSPRIVRYSSTPKGPNWKDVRRVLKFDFGSSVQGWRTTAVLALCAIYAMRACEIASLQLSDLDWTNEILTIKRGKNGRIQQFPIAYEVGEKVLNYLKYGRPRCTCRSLFVTIRPPYRPVGSSEVSNIVSGALKSLGVVSSHYGAHALRHSCATYLLRKGSGLQDIADFLGHRDLRSVSIYAKCDLRSLRQVANFSLGGVK